MQKAEVKSVNSVLLYAILVSIILKQKCSIIHCSPQKFETGRFEDQVL